jgi:hypothetical protein
MAPTRASAEQNSRSLDLLFRSSGREKFSYNRRSWPSFYGRTLVMTEQAMRWRYVSIGCAQFNFPQQNWKCECSRFRWGKVPIRRGVSGKMSEIKCSAARIVSKLTVENTFKMKSVLGALVALENPSGISVRVTLARKGGAAPSGAAPFVYESFRF